MPQTVAHAQHRKCAKESGRHRADADEAVHVRRPVQEIAKTVDIVRTVDIHDRQNEQKLYERKGQRILRAPENIHKGGRVGDAPCRECMAHRDGDRRHEKEDGDEEPRAHGADGLARRIVLRVFCLHSGRGGSLRRLRRGCALDARTVARLLHRRDDGGGARDILVVGETHRICEEIDGDIRRSCHFRHRALDPRRARRTGHACDIKTFLLHSIPFL